jgi:hypothetical protein
MAWDTFEISENITSTVHTSEQITDELISKLNSKVWMEYYWSNIQYADM